MKNNFRLIKIFFYLFAVIFLAYWCGTHQWIKFNTLHEQTLFSWLSLFFFSYLFLNHVFRLYQVLKPLETKNNTVDKDFQEHTLEQDL